MSAHWHIGMEVECILDDGPAGEIHVGDRLTISEVLASDVGDSMLQFKEITFAGGDYYNAGFNAACFRPVTKRTTDISIFTQMLNPSKVDA